MDFLELLEQQNSKRMSVTQNGALAYASSGSHLLDFHYEMSAFRDMDTAEFLKWFARAYNEDPMLAIKEAFYAGDIRLGMGERRTFRRCMQYICTWHPEIAKAIIPLVPEYNRWDSVLTFYRVEKTRSAAVNFIKNQLKEDIENANNGRPISLCAKWLPSVNASSFKTVLLAKELADDLGMTERRYRKLLSKLRSYLNIVEKKMSAREWSEINYEAVPSRANLLYSEAFYRNDRERRSEYLEDLAKGKKKINSGVLFPHEIVGKTLGATFRKDDKALKLYESMWKALPDNGISNTLVVRDGSGSMTAHYGSSNTTPLDVASALAIYLSEHNSGIWKDKFITFSRFPEIVDMHNCKSLAEKVRLVYGYDDWSNTDIYATMKLILITAMTYDIPESDMPKMILILSDMQFDAHLHNFGGSLFDGIKREFEEAGYELPTICFWNLATEAYKTIPMQDNVVLCSGFSPNIVNMIMSGDFKDPYALLVDTLNGDRYKPVEEAVRGLL